MLRCPGKAHGRRTRIPLDLTAGPTRNVWVRFLAPIKVRSRTETIRFARVYHRC
jgi:hypothetical protein